MGFALTLRIAGARPVLRGRAHMWQVVRGYGVGRTFTVSDLHAATNERNRGTVWSFVDRLVKAGYLVSQGDGPRGSTLYAVAKAPEELPSLGKDGAPGRLGRLQLQMWRTIRAPIARNGFSARDLAAFASIETAVVSAKSAAQYIRHLEKAGYLLATDKDEAGSQRWRLKPSMNTGPKPPAILSATLMFDRNSNEVVGDEVVAQEVSS